MARRPTRNAVRSVIDALPSPEINVASGRVLNYFARALLAIWA